MYRICKGVSMKPLIGITAGVTWEYQRDGFQGYRRHYLSFDYTEAVIKAGGIPVILPVISDEGTIRDMVGRLDGLLLSGGTDISPVIFGEEPEEKLGMTVIDRDRCEVMILDCASERKLPVLGICRGFQLLNCYYGGTLYQDLSSNKESFIKHDFSSLPGNPAHTIEMKEGSLIRKLLGEYNLVNSHHHQTLHKIAENFTVTAWAKDGAAEAIEGTAGDQFLFGVQFHPEMMLNQTPQVAPIFRHLIEEAEKFRS